MSDHNETERWRLENETEKLRNQVHAMQDVVRSAQYLADAIHTQGNATGGGLFGDAYDNLRAALRAYYLPNGR
jgi:hypothetical protein